MSFNIDFDIVSLAFMVVLAVRFFYRRQFPLLSNQLYGAIVLLCIGDLALDIAGTVTLAYCRGAQTWIPQLVNALYYLTQIIMPVTLLAYLVALLKSQKNVPARAFALGSLPAAVCLIAYLAALPQGLVFTITPEGEYGYGPLSSITYICVGIYFIASLIILVANRRYYSPIMRWSYIALLACLLVACLIQYQMPTLLLTGTAMAIGITILFFSLQDPQKMTDKATGLFNEPAAHEYLSAQLESGRDFHLVALEVHHLQNYNILYGRNAGTTVLRHFASCAPTSPHIWSFRVTDSIVLTSFRNIDDLERYLAAVTARRSEPVVLPGGKRLLPLVTTVSIPHALDLETSDGILRTVESMLLDRNLKGHLGTDIRIDNSMAQLLGRDASLEQHLRDSVVTGEGFSVVYQPIYSVSQERFVTAEALSRYAIADIGSISPGIFVPIIEGCGLNTPFDLILVENVFKDIASGAFDRCSIYDVHINLSAATFAAEGISDQLEALAKRYGIDPGRVVFEITETAASESEDELVAAAVEIREKGFLLSLDDFGSGYSNITRLMAIPFDSIKLDKGLVQDCSSIVPGLLHVIVPLGLPVVAEGVENTQQLHLVTENGVDLIQGYLYSRPLPLDEAVACAARAEADRNAMPSL